MNRTLPLTSQNRLTKVLAAIRNHERFSPAKVLLIQKLYSSYVIENTPDEVYENIRKMYETIGKYRPNLIKYLSSK